MNIQLPAFMRPLSLEERVTRELAQARRDRLDAASNLEYQQAAMALAVARIERLERETRDFLAPIEGSTNA